MSDQEVYDTAADAEAARQAGETVDYSTQVRGDDGLTDDERRQAKIKRGQDAERKSDAERARQERENGEPAGTRGRAVAGSQRPDDVTDEELKDVGLKPGDPVTAEAVNEVYRRRAEGGAPSAGHSTEPSSGQTPNSGASGKPDHRPTAPETGQHSSRTPQGGGGARSTGTSGKARK